VYGTVPHTFFLNDKKEKDKEEEEESD